MNVSYLREFGFLSRNAQRFAQQLNLEQALQATGLSHWEEESRALAKYAASCLSVCLPDCLPACLSVCLSVSVCPSICLSVCVSNSCRQGAIMALISDCITLSVLLMMCHHKHKS